MLDVIDIEGFMNEGYCLQVAGPSGLGADKDNFDPVVEQVAGHLNAAHYRHIDIRKDEIGMTVSRFLKSIPPVKRFLDSVSLIG